MSLEAEIVQAIADDLEANAGLKPHNLFTNRRPRVMLPAMCPALVVWPDEEAPIVEDSTTVRFEYRTAYLVSWHEATVAEAQTLQTDPEVSESLLNARAAIRARVHYLSRHGLNGPSEAWEVMPAGGRYFRTPVEEGLTEGYIVGVIVRTTQT